VTGCAGWCLIVVNTNHPFVFIEVELVLVTIIGDSMLGFFIDLFLRVIRTQMALAAVFRLARLIL
jgi:hypothetical protein